MKNPLFCSECGKKIPEERRNQKRVIKTCSKKCSNKRNTTPYKKRLEAQQRTQINPPK